MESKAKKVKKDFTRFEMLFKVYIINRLRNYNGAFILYELANAKKENKNEKSRRLT